MKTQLFALTLLVSFGAPLARADVVDSKVQDLYTQGYTHFEVARGTRKSQIEAYAPNGTKMIVVLDNQSGLSLAEQLVQGSSADISQHFDSDSRDDDAASDSLRDQATALGGATAVDHSDDAFGHDDSPSASDPDRSSEAANDHVDMASQHNSDENAGYDSHDNDSHDSDSQGDDSHDNDSHDSDSQGDDSHDNDSHDSDSQGDDHDQGEDD